MFNTLIAQDLIVPDGFLADFIQKVTNPKKRVLIYKGKVIMRAPSTLKWIYKEPTNKEVCSSGNKITVIDHDLEQVSFYQMKEGIDLGKIIKEAKHYRDRLYLAKYKKRYYTLEVNERGEIDQIAYRDDIDNIVNIHFENIRYLKTPPSDKDINCTIPENYDLVN